MLTKCLESGNVDLQMHAAEAIGELGAEAATAVPSLKVALKSVTRDDMPCMHLALNHALIQLEDLRSTGLLPELKIAMLLVEEGPELAIVKCRSIMEQVLRSIPRPHHSDFPVDAELETIISQLKAERLIPRKIEVLSRVISLIGLAGIRTDIHDEPLRSSDANLCLYGLTILLEWFKRSIAAGRPRGVGGVVAQLPQGGDTPAAEVAGLATALVIAIRRIGGSAQMRADALEVDIARQQSLLHRAGLSGQIKMILGLLSSSPDMALVKSRAVLEAAFQKLADLCRLNLGCADLENLIDALRDKRQLPPKVEALARTVSVLGRLGERPVMDGESLSHREAYITLSALDHDLGVVLPAVSGWRLRACSRRALIK